MGKVSREQAGYFINGVVFGAILIGLIIVWGHAPAFARVILTICLVGILAQPWLPEIDLRMKRFQPVVSIMDYKKDNLRITTYRGGRKETEYRNKIQKEGGE